MTFVMEDEPWRNLEVVTTPWLAAWHLKGTPSEDVCCPGNGHDVHHHSVLWGWAGGGGGGGAVKLYEPGRQTRIA